MPVYNGLTDDSHPTQILADFMTMEEHSDKPLSKIAFCYLGDARNNMGNSLLLARRAHGDGRAPLRRRRRSGRPAKVVARAHALAKHSGARIARHRRPEARPSGCDFVYTDVWVSLGEPPAKWAERIELLKPLPGQRAR